MNKTGVWNWKPFLFFSGTASLFCWPMLATQKLWEVWLQVLGGLWGRFPSVLFLLNLGCSSRSWSQKHVDITETFLLSAFNITPVACIRISEHHVPTLLRVRLFQWLHWLGCVWKHYLTFFKKSDCKNNTVADCCHGFDLKSVVRPCGLWLLFVTKWEQARLECSSSHTQD